MIVIYCDSFSPRLQYIINILFKHNATLQIASEQITLNDSPVICYTQKKLSNKYIWIRPHSLLFQNNIKQQNTECFIWNGFKAFFKTEGDIPFDIFAASFYLITRYEEYLLHKLDEYGRYAYINSLAYKENFLHQPLVNLWLAELTSQLQQHPTSNIQHPTFNFIPTYDIDIAYAYKHNSFLRKSGGIVKDIVTGKLKQLSERIKVYLRNRKDPFDVYDWLNALHKKYQLKPIYFFLVAEKRKEFDKNLSPHNRAIETLIQQHAAKYSTGIHPSWQSFNDEIILKKEVELLANITHVKTTNSRQHYIKINLPDTYRHLINNGIKNDYSMGYGSINGFRASYCLPYNWFDLEKDEETGLTIYPFCFMDANSHFEQHFSAQQAAEELQYYYNIIKQVNGQLITVFHNHFLTEQKQWFAWRKMYEDFLRSHF